MKINVDYGEVVPLFREPTRHLGQQLREPWDKILATTELLAQFRPGRRDFSFYLRRCTRSEPKVKGGKTRHITKNLSYYTLGTVKHRLNVWKKLKISRGPKLEDAIHLSASLLGFTEFPEGNRSAINADFNVCSLGKESKALSEVTSIVGRKDRVVKIIANDSPEAVSSRRTRNKKISNASPCWFIIDL